MPRILIPAGILAPGVPLTVSWTNLNFSSYRVNLYNAGNPGQPLLEETTGDNSLTISTAALEQGDYIVGVQGFNPETSRSERMTGIPSEARFTLGTAMAVEESIPVVALIPEPVLPEPPPVQAAPEPPVSVPEPDAEPIQVSAFEEPVQVLPPAQDTLGQLILTSGGGTVSENYPLNGQVLSRGQLANAQAVNFVWEGNAPEYRFALYRADGEVVIAPSLVSVPSFTLSNPGRLTPGEYVWQVFERIKEGWEELPSTAKRFTISESPPLIKQLPVRDPGALYGR
jgi:hypothetical protein